MLNFLNVPIKIFWCIHEDPFFSSLGQLWKWDKPKTPKPEQTEWLKRKKKTLSWKTFIFCIKVPDSTRAGKRVGGGIAFMCVSQMKAEITNNVSGTGAEILNYSIGCPIKALWGHTLFPSCHLLSCCQRIWRDIGRPQVSAYTWKWQCRTANVLFPRSLGDIITSRQSGFL